MAYHTKRPKGCPWGRLEAGDRRPAAHAAQAKPADAGARR